MKIIKNNILGIIIGIILASSIGITVAYQINASSISYNKSGININVENAIAELYGMANTYINYTKGENGGEEILLDPTGKTTNCTTYDSTVGQNDGCMKFYIYAEDTNNYYAILDHNTTGVFESLDCIDNNCFKQAQIQVIEDTKTWLPQYQARNISADEVWNITKSVNGQNNWSSSKSTISLGFNGTLENKSKYAFLYDNLYDCEIAGCRKSDSVVYNGTAMFSYWTQNISDDETAWIIDRSGNMWVGAVKVEDYAITRGVRPVITIAK